MLVNRRSADKCCEFCFADYGKSPNRKAKKVLKRTIRRREKQTWKREL